MNPKFKDDFLRVWLCSPVHTDRCRESKTFLWSEINTVMKMQILVYVTTAPIEAPFTHWGFFLTLIVCTSPQIQSVLAQSPQRGKSRQKCPVMSPRAFISHLFELSFFWNFPLQLCDYSKYFLLLNLLSESRPLSSKYRFHMNIRSFSLCGHLNSAVQNEVQSLCL